MNYEAQKSEYFLLHKNYFLIQPKTLYAVKRLVKDWEKFSQNMDFSIRMH